jgi:hypothetical protein
VTLRFIAVRTTTPETGKRHRPASH